MFLIQSVYAQLDTQKDLPFKVHSTGIRRVMFIFYN